jgi:hypothetical protein
MALSEYVEPFDVSHIEVSLNPVPCDYIDVSPEEGDQPRFKLQPHKSSGLPIGSAVVLEMEGARALWRKLGQILGEENLVA